jgi:hypothetical protein
MLLKNGFFSLWKLKICPIALIFIILMLTLSAFFYLFSEHIIISIIYILLGILVVYADHRIHKAYD